MALRLLILVFAMSLTGFANASQCRIISCWDSCTSGWKNVYGDTCDSDWNSELGCWGAVGRCEGRGGDDICEGESTTCWDSCTSGWVTVPGNSCDSAWDSSRGCWESIGVCN